MPVAKPSPAVKSAPKTTSVAARTAKPAPVKTARVAAPVKVVSKAAANTVVKTAAKPITKAAAKPAAVKAPAGKSAAKPSLEKSASAAAAEAKPPKIKLVRDSFTIPRAEYETLDALKARLVKLTRPAKKSEVLRAGIAVLAALNDTALCAALDAVPAIKTGRPKKAK